MIANADGFTRDQVMPATIPPNMRPTLFVVVDTEEEFDWGAPFSRANISVRAARHIDRLQRVLSRYLIRPTYVVDYPIASQPEGSGPFKEIADSGEATIGAHLHPWVNPPYSDEPCRGRNSYGCRLKPKVEREMISVLRRQIEDAFDVQPRVYKAGRYGFGPSTAEALESLDFAIDVSVNPRMDYTPDGGPTFEAFDPRPFFFNGGRPLLEIPCSTDFVGICGSAAGGVHRVISHEAFRSLRLVGIMARLGVVNKIMLSPETSRVEEMIALTRTLLTRGVRTFSLTLHSPSVEPGCTPYVRTRDDLEAFLDRIAAYCDFFFDDLAGVPGTPDGFLRSLDIPAIAVQGAVS